MLEKEYSYYLENIGSLKEKYLNKFIAIKCNDLLKNIFLLKEILINVKS